MLTWALLDCFSATQVALGIVARLFNLVTYRCPQAVTARHAKTRTARATKRRCAKIAKQRRESAESKPARFLFSVWSRN